MLLILFNPQIGPLSGATTLGQSGPGRNGNEGGTPHSPKLQHCWNLTIRLFSVIYRTLIRGGGLTPLQRCSQWPYEQMIYARPSICPREWHTQNPLGFQQTDQLISTRQPDLIIINNSNKKRTCKIVTFISIIIGALGTVTKSLLKGQEDLEIWGRMEITQITTLLRSARILRRVLETWRNLLLLILQNCRLLLSGWPQSKIKIKWK